MASPPASRTRTNSHFPSSPPYSTPPPPSNPTFETSSPPTFHPPNPLSVSSSTFSLDGLTPSLGASGPPESLSQPAAPMGRRRICHSGFISLTGTCPTVRTFPCRDSRRTIASADPSSTGS
uniref:Uncharacterized protein n=1 Tax=Opuntia streptacantha TaxID=393608 RepID=A0A7C9DB54_OPUST